MKFLLAVSTLLASATETLPDNGCGACSNVDQFVECSKTDAKCSDKDVTVGLGETKCASQDKKSFVSGDISTEKIPLHHAKLAKVMFNAGKDVSKHTLKYKLLDAENNCSAAITDGTDMEADATYDKGSTTTTYTLKTPMDMAGKKFFAIIAQDAGKDDKAMTFEFTYHVDVVDPNLEQLSDESKTVCPTCPFEKGEKLSEWIACFNQPKLDEGCYHKATTLTGTVTGALNNNVLTADFTKIADAHPKEFKPTSIYAEGAAAASGKTCESTKLKIDEKEVSVDATKAKNGLVFKLPEDQPMGKKYVFTNDDNCTFANAKPVVITSMWTTPGKDDPKPTPDSTTAGITAASAAAALGMVFYSYF